MTEREWTLIEPHTLGKPGTAGGTWKENRLFVNAVVWRVRTDWPWRDLPERFGKWNSVARRFRRWAQAGAWKTVFKAVQEPDGKWVLVDATTVKAHAATAGQKKSAPLECLSRSGFATKVHAVSDALSNGGHFDLPPGEAADCLLVPDWRATLPEKPGNVGADKASDTTAVPASGAAHQAEAVVPPKSNRLGQRDTMSIGTTTETKSSAVLAD